MKFSEAMEKLKEGSKVTRQIWGKGIYFLKIDDAVFSFYPNLENYTYSEDIMLSDGWIVEGCAQEMRFCDIIPYLQGGCHAHMKHWNKMSIYLDNSTNSLVIQSMEMFPFTPDFASFSAEDWVVIE